MTITSAFVALLILGAGETKASANVPTAVANEPPAPYAVDSGSATRRIPRADAATPQPPAARIERVDPMVRPAASVAVTPEVRKAADNATEQGTSLAVSPRRQPTRLRPREKDATSSPQGEKGFAARQWAWWVTTGAGLVIVLCLIFGSSRALKRIVPGMSSLPDDGGPVHVLHRSLLSPKHAVCLVRCGGRILLVGYSGDRMQTLTEITDPEEIDVLKGQCMQAQPKSTTKAFRDMFAGGRQSFSSDIEPENDIVEPPNAEEAGKPASSSFSEQLQDVRKTILDWKARANS
ncbi:Flagellar biosynthesis protein, FliO [Planctomycetes bacterium Pan216]|uniref:Flagellar biosynthesis protein, FliO n=1 Tax=Kolteria novifilia TaxID=2527975 RepID=A0A518B961_9BACT|nr:Flagellar biosynthesis protein, FliO [Planctomycetes bacterium Pan216]